MCQCHVLIRARARHEHRSLYMLAATLGVRQGEALALQWADTRRALVAGKLPAVTFHDLRHSAASMMAEVGVTPAVVAAMLGHAKVSTTLNVYTHALSGSLREAAHQVEAALAANRTANT